MNENLTYKNSDKFDQICQPIFESSPINFVSFCRLYDNGLYVGIMTDPKWTGLYLKKHYQSTLPLWIKTKMDKVNVGFELWSLSSLYSINRDTQSLQDDCHAFEYHNGICLIDKYPSYSELTSFSSAHMEGIDSFFLEKKDILRHYILYFKEKIFTDPDLSKEFDHPYVVPELISSTTTLPKPMHLEASTLNLNKFYIGYPMPDDSYLTQRELDCLLPFLLGIPKKYYAAKLSLSVRTIESHINNVMKKCRCSGMAQLKMQLLNNRFISTLLMKEIQSYI